MPRSVKENVHEHSYRRVVKPDMSAIARMPHPCRRIYPVLICLVGAGLGGCATNMQIDRAHMHVPVKVLVVQSPINIKPDRLQKVFAPDSKEKLSLSSPPIAQGITHSQQHALSTLDTALSKQASLILTTPPPTAKPDVDEIRKTAYTSPLTQDEANRLQTSTGADALLRFHITDYGLTPKSWRSGYITFEVVTTLAITIAIASIGTSVAKGAAGAYLAQEAVEETAEGYAGFWALDVVCRPVRIEAELIRLNPVKVVWTDSDTGLADVSLSRLTRKVSTQERNMQLYQSSDYAVNQLVSDLSKALGPFKRVHIPHSFPNGR